MSPNPAETLRFLFGLQQEQIDNDLAAALENFNRILRSVEEFAALEADLKTPGRVALQYHNQMLLYHTHSQRPTVSEDEGLHLVDQQAMKIAEEACRVADQQGRLAEISRTMAEIEKREGLAEGQYWPPDEGPPDYEELHAQREHISTKVRDVIVLQLLRRYRFDEYAALYEDDRMTYDVMREVGRRLIYRDRDGGTLIDVNAIMDDLILSEILSEYGGKGFALLRQRLAAAGYEEP